MKLVIKNYEEMAGQLMNFDKLSIFFNSNVQEDDKKRIDDVLRVRIANSSKKYLGLPTMVGRRKKDALVHIRELFI